MKDVGESEEVWQDIPSYDGRYQASSLGRIRSFGTRGRSEPPVVMKLQKRGDGNYLGAGVTDPVAKKQRYQFVQVLVARTFLGPKPAGLQVNHINGDKHDNRVSNLEYTTPKENTNHALRNGFKARSGFGRCLSADEVQSIRNEPSTLSTRTLGKKYGTSHETIRRIRLGTRWACLGLEGKA